MDELLSEFVVETREMLERIGGALLRWEETPDDRTHVDEIFRFVHTVKGSCGFLDLPRIAALADAAETALGTVRTGERTPDRALVAALLAVIDRIQMLASALETPDAVLPAADGDAPLVAALAPAARAPAASAARFVPPEAPLARSVRVAVPLLEELMTQLSDVVLVRNELARHARDIDDPHLTRSLDRLTSAVGLLRDSVTRTRMQPIARVFSALPRLVRDTAATLGKQVKLEIVGHDVEIDREMGEAIRDPLLHIVRNAIDHGIECPDDRRLANKPPMGTLRIAAVQSGNQVEITVSDDGRGVDIGQITARAIAAGLLDAAAAARLAPAAAVALVFEPGLSTARTVSGISGRGVGMDVVRANVERLGGVVQIVNDPGHGLAITLRAPLTLSIVTALTVMVGTHRFAIPRGALEEIVPVGGDKARLEHVAGMPLAVVRGLVLPVVSLAAALDLPAIEPRLLLIVATHPGRRCAVAVDAVCEHEELVVRAMAPQVAACGLFAGQSLDENGRPIILLDAAALVAAAGDEVAVPQARREASVATKETIILARALDGRRIAIRSDLVERLVPIAAVDRVDVEGATFIRIDHRLCRVATIGAPVDSFEAAVAILLHDGSRRVVLPVASVDDLVPIGALVPLGAPAGTTVVEAIVEGFGEPAMLLDGFSLLAQAPRPAPASRPLAAIALPRSAWASGLLAPMLTAAGYDVSFDRHPEAAVTILLEGDPDLPIRGAVVTLRRSGIDNVSAEHHDAATLMQAIAQARAAA